MAWFCDRCRREVDGDEVDVGNIGPGYQGIGPYHRKCLGPVRPMRDEGAEIAAKMLDRINKARREDS